MTPYLKSSNGFRLLLSALCGILVFGLAGGLQGEQIENLDEPDLETLPKPIKRSHPEYPFELRREGMMGGVLVEFILTKNGKVAESRSFAETDPAFGEAAVKAVAKWKFKPGLKDGKPINMRMVVPIYFTLNNSGIEDPVGEIQAVITGFPPQSPATVSDEFQYDQAPTLKIAQAPAWPWVDGVPVREGTADLFFAINAQGRVAQVRIVSATNNAFGQAARAALEYWEFEPAERDGKPVPALGRKEMQFKLYLPKDASELRLQREIQDGSAQYAKGGELDAPLRPLFRKPPQYPLFLIKSRQPGKAVIECIIDEDGRVCLPRIIEASQEEFGWSAAAAAARWRFAPPTVKGKPVMVKMRIPFEFQGQEE